MWSSKEAYSFKYIIGSVGIDLKKTGGSDVEMFEILPRDWNLKPIFTQNERLST